MRINIKGIYAKSYKAKDGTTRQYYYHRATGARLPDSPASPEFLLRIRELDRRPASARVAVRTLGDLMLRFRESSRCAPLAPLTRALLRKLADGRTAPYPGRNYPTASELGMPSVV